MITLALTLCLVSDPAACITREIATDAESVLSCTIGAALLVPSLVPPGYTVREFSCHEGRSL